MSLRMSCVTRSLLSSSSHSTLSSLLSVRTACPSVLPASPVFGAALNVTNVNGGGGGGAAASALPPRSPLLAWCSPFSSFATNNRTSSSSSSSSSSTNSSSSSDWLHSSSVPVRPPFLASNVRKMAGYIIDMDGVLYYSKKLIPGVVEFIHWLQKENKRFLFLTNSSERSPRELQEKLARYGIHVQAENFYTSALATANFLARQRPRGSAFVIGEPGLISALYDVGYSMNDVNPDYVVVGETRNYNYHMLETAVELVRKGARLIGTNRDIADRSEDSFIPACGSLIRPIEMTSGREAYFIGKPNPLIMRAALNKLQIKREEACIIGDRLDTDIQSGIQSEIHTVMVLTGVCTLEDVLLSPYRPDCILPSIYHVLKDGFEQDPESARRK